MDGPDSRSPATLCTKASGSFFDSLEEHFTQTDWGDVDGNRFHTPREFDNGIGIAVCEQDHLAAVGLDLLDALYAKLLRRLLCCKAEGNAAVVSPHVIQCKVHYELPVVDDADMFGDPLHFRNLM